MDTNYHGKFGNHESCTDYLWDGPLQISAKCETQVEDVDNELGHFVCKVIGMQHSRFGIQNDNLAIKEELHKKDLAMDEIEL